MGLYYSEVWRMEVVRKFKLKWQFHRLGMISTNIETHSVCNRHCEFCFNHPRFAQRKQGKMPESLWYKIIDQLAEVNFSGRISPHFYNEPLMDSRLPELIKYTREKLPDAWIQINSNGDLLTEDLFLLLVRCGVNYFFVTNYDEDDKPLLQALQDKYPALISVVKNSDMWRTDRGGEIFKKDKVLEKPCLRPTAQLVVNWEGKVLLCCMDYYAETSLGDLNQNSVFDIWNGKEFRKLRSKIAISRQKGLPICHKCDDPGFIPW